MAMVCAQCGQAYYGSERKCDKCGVLLLMQHHGVKQIDDTMPPIDPRNRWQQTPWGRIVVSVIIAMGLAYCLQQLCKAWILASGVETDVNNWMTPTGLIWLHAITGICVLLCGVLAGAGQDRGITSGGMVGLLCGMAFLGIHRGSRDVLPPYLFFAQPFLLMIWGLIGGVIGYRIWKPVPLFVGEQDMGVSGVPVPRLSKKLWKGPIHVFRVLVGAGVALAGAIFAKELLDMIIRNGQGLFRIDSHLTERLIVYQLIGLAAFVGGSIAGSSTRNGFKQGLCAGVLAAALYLGVQLANPRSVLEIAIFITSGIALMSVVGGVFGAMLFPPLAKTPPKSAIPY